MNVDDRESRRREDEEGKDKREVGWGGVGQGGGVGGGGGERLGVCVGGGEEGGRQREGWGGGEQEWGKKVDGDFIAYVDDNYWLITRDGP